MQVALWITNVASPPLQRANGVLQWTGVTSFPPDQSAAGIRKVYEQHRISAHSPCNHQPVLRFAVDLLFVRFFTRRPILAAPASETWHWGEFGLSADAVVDKISPNSYYLIFTNIGKIDRFIWCNYTGGIVFRFLDHYLLNTSSLSHTDHVSREPATSISFELSTQRKIELSFDGLQS